MIPLSEGNGCFRLKHRREDLDAERRAEQRAAEAAAEAAAETAAEAAAESRSKKQTTAAQHQKDAGSKQPTARAKAYTISTS